MVLRIYSSNRQERLAEILKQQFFADAVSIFDRRIIATSSSIHQQWLQYQFASDPNLGIAMGMEFLREDQCISLIAGLFPCAKEGMVAKHHPTRLELGFAIEHQLAFQAKNSSAPYTKRQRRRDFQLAEACAGLFERYGRYAGEWLKQWTVGNSSDFQHQLWRLFYDDAGSWSYPYRWLDELNFSQCAPPPGMQVHLFCPNFLCRLHQNLLEKLAEHIPVSIYLLSPCQMFWTDQLTGRERRRLNAYWQRRGASPTEQQRLGDLLSDTNPLLAQLGRLGRETAAELENAEAMSAESYQMSAAAMSHPEYSERITDDVQAIEGPQSLSLLHAIQSDFLVLRNPHDSPPLCFDVTEDSVQCHAVPSRTREVQVIYDQLLHLIDRHANDPQPITAGDIRLFVPDLRCYAPLLEATFGAPDSRLALQLLDIPLSDHSLFVQSFLALLHLAQGRWEAPVLLEFLSSPFVQKCHQWVDSDLARLREWVQQIPIYWGEDDLHRSTLLREAHCSTDSIDGNMAGTWQQGLHTLLLQLARAEVEQPTVEFSDANLIGSCITLLQSLADDLRPLRDGTQMTTDEWGKYLQCLCNAYLTPTDRISTSHRELLFAHIETLRRACRSLPDASWAFPSILKRLEALLERHGVSINEGDLDTLRACALRPHRSVPARIVVLLGMEDGAFPRKGGKSPLDLLKGAPTTDYCPSDTETDRYLFLECLLNTRDYLLISYSQTSLEDGKEQGPCLPVQELLSYIKAHFMSETSPKSITVNHPFYAFDARYFIDDSPLHSYSKHAYQAAQAYLKKGLSDRQPPQRTPLSVIIQRPKTELIINLRDLETLVRDPAKLYLNQALGIYLRTDNSREVKSTEPLVLSTRQRYALRDDVLREPLERVMERAIKRGQMPQGVFGATAHEQLRDDLLATLALQTSARGLRLLPSIQLNAQCYEPKAISPDLWQFPAIQLENTKIVGTLDRLTVQGLLVEGEGSFPDAVKAWPAFLALQVIRPYLPHLCQTMPDNALMFLETGRSKDSFVDDPIPHLECLVDYYSRCLQGPSPIHSAWARQFLSGTDLGLATLIEKDLRDNTTRFRHLHWLCGTPSREELLPLIFPWIADAKALYRPLATNWYRMTEDADATL